MTISKLGVLGGGTMGAGIAQVGAQSGLQVTLVDIDDSVLERALAGMNKSWGKAESRGGRQSRGGN